MAHNYYQQPHHYQPQNIYQQLGAQQPQPHQPVQGGSQIQQRLSLVQQGQPSTQSLVQQRIQTFQRSSHVPSSGQQQQQLVHVQQQPPPQQQLVQYQTRPQSQFYPSQYPYPVSQVPTSSAQGYPYSPWHNSQYPQYVAPPPASVLAQPHVPSTESQRRPLPDLIKRQESLPQPRPGSTSPTRSRPLPTPTPGPFKIASGEMLNQTGKISQQPISTNLVQSSSPPKANVAPVIEPHKRGRASPPRFSTVSLSPSNPTSPNDSLPSTPSSVSSLSPDSLSGSPVIPASVAQTLVNTTPKAATKSSATISDFSPSPTLSKLKADLAGNTVVETKSKTPNQKAVPVWKRTLPDVLPPLLPTPPPNPSQQKLQLQRQSTKDRSQNQQHTPQQTPQTRYRSSTLPPTNGPPPPIPSHSKPKLDSSFSSAAAATRPPSQPIHQPNHGHVETDSDEAYEDEEEEEYFDAQRVTAEISSPQYGIRDLPARSSAFSSPNSLPQITRYSAHQSTSRTLANGTNLPPIQSSTSLTEGGGSNFGNPSRSAGTQGVQSRAEGEQSMTMRLAAAAISGTGLPQPPSLSGDHNSRKYVDLDDTPPPRAAFVMQRGRPSNHASSKDMQSTNQGSRALPTPGKRGRPQSQIYEPPSTSGGAQPGTARPQSQIYRVPLKGGPGDNAEFKTQLQRARSFGRGRQLPQPQQHQQQRESWHLDQGPLRRKPQPNSPPSIPRADIAIESPAPVGGRDKRADFGKMESEGETALSSPLHSPQPVPMINIQTELMEGEGSESEKRPHIPEINVEGLPELQQYIARTKVAEGEQQGPKISVFEIPGISVSGPGSGAESNTSAPPSQPLTAQGSRNPDAQIRDPSLKRGVGLTCGGCGSGIVGRIVNAMEQRWHPECFRCTICKQPLEHVSSYEWEGRAYCHLDYHENFAPKCYSCRTPIYEERFISLDDPGLGKRAYHEQHFFCSECGDPFLTPSSSGQSSRTGELTVSGDGDFALDDVGFIVYRGYPYCEACHVRLRLPKCKRCKRSIRDHDRAVEALGGKWCWGCFTCKRCESPFENPSFFERGGDPYCELCFTLILRNEL